MLNHTSKPTYSVVISVDDPSAGNTPDASIGYSLTITESTGGTPALIISEVAPWSSGNSPAALRVDWFEVTNIGTAAANISGWRMDDGSASLASSVALNGISSIAPGESVIFMETADLAGKTTAFKNVWFGSVANAPAHLQFGNYSGGGLGLSTTEPDGVNLFDDKGALQLSVSFNFSVLPNPTLAPFRSYDNSAGLNNTTISTLSANGVNGAFVAVSDANE